VKWIITRKVWKSNQEIYQSKRRYKMGKSIKVLVAVLINVALITALFPGSAFAQGNKTYFTGTSCNGGLLDPGAWTLLGNGEVRITGLRSFHINQTDDPRISGVDTIVLNAVGDPIVGYGTFWGTTEVVNDGGSWTGQFVGKQENGLYTFIAVYHGSGAYEGLVANWNYSPGDIVCGVLSGYIVETGAGD
jgi:hypothetical protein